MAVLIFKLRHVPHDEAQDVRELLSENNIEFYETPAGIFGISMPGLWLKHDEQADRAKKLIDEYQQLRYAKAREEYRLRPKSILDLFKEDPARYLGSILAILLIGYFTVILFLNLR